MYTEENEWCDTVYNKVLLVSLIATKTPISSDMSIIPSPRTISIKIGNCEAKGALYKISGTREYIEINKNLPSEYKYYTMILIPIIFERYLDIGYIDTYIGGWGLYGYTCTIEEYLAEQTPEENKLNEILASTIQNLIVNNVTNKPLVARKEADIPIYKPIGITTNKDTKIIGAKYQDNQ